MRRYGEDGNFRRRRSLPLHFDPMEATTEPHGSHNDPKTKIYYSDKANVLCINLFLSDLKTLQPAFDKCLLLYQLAPTHLLHHDCGSGTSSERPSEAVKAKGHASSMKKETNSRRTGKTVTDMTPIWRRERKDTKIQIINKLLQYCCNNVHN